jgi:inorganic pyrophosphatase
MRLNDQKIDDEMIKHNHENKSFQTISAKNKFESHFSDHISHFEIKYKTRY